MNVGADPHKHGFHTEGLLQQTEKIVKFKNLKLCGMMTILPFLEQAQDSQNLYKKMRQFQRKIMEDIAPSCSCLSMGMSRDYIYALKEGATHIRLGTSLYGPRP